MILALQGNDVDVIAQFTPAGAAAMLNSPSYKIIKLKSANHRELSMRNDVAPFTDPRVRQAVALTLDRPGAVAALLSGDGTVANDYPFGPRYPVDRHVRASAHPGHHQGQAAAVRGRSPERLLDDAEDRAVPGDPAARAGDRSRRGQGGDQASLNVETQTLYYGKATFGNSDWLDGTMSLVDYGEPRRRRTCSCRPAHCQRGRGTPRSSRTRSTTSLVEAVRGGARPPDAEDDRREDRDPAAAGDADRLSRTGSTA